MSAVVGHEVARGQAVTIDGVDHQRRAWDPLRGDVLGFGQITLPDRCDQCRRHWPCPAVRGEAESV